MLRSIIVVAVAVAAGQLSVAARADAQVWKKIKDQVEQKVDARKAKADSAAAARVGQTVDSALAKTGRGVDTVVSKAGGIADAVVNKSGDVVSNAAGALRGKDADEERLAAELEAGRAVLAEVRFDGTTDQLTDAAAPHLERLAKLLRARSGTFVIEGHVDDSGSAGADQSLSEKRAAAVKARLVAAGVAADRLFAMGLGATRPPSDARTSRARIEVARMK
jgi:outer membrane protein OmpA-like peptidoglycan-associated protein